MKKLVALLLALMLCLGVALAETADVAGVWYLNEMSDGEMTINPATLGREMTMTLNEDGTAAANDSMGEVTEGTWAVDGENVVITFDGDPVTFALVDGNLVGNQDETTMTFGKEKAEVETFVLGEAKTDAVMADYNGTWNATLAEMMGMQFPMETLEMSMQFKVEDGKVIVMEGEGEEVSSVEEEAFVENGALIVKDGEQLLPLQLHEGDVLVLVQEIDEGMVLSIYFERVVEEEAAAN